jgi:hypothetical protein
MTFKLDHHNKILTILNSLDDEILKKGSAYFGGGTLLALDFDEYRWSKDIDFISPVSSLGYGYLRTIVFDSGYKGLFRDLSKITIGSGTTNQYGIRMVVLIDDVPIKMEIVAEGRFELDLPRYPEWSPVACLSLSDCFTSKLLANSDRFMVDGVDSRDLIDLAVLRLQSVIPPEAVKKAEKAYEVMRPLTRSIQRFQERPNYRRECFAGLKIDIQQVPKIVDGIDLLAQDVGLAATERVFNEQPDIFLNFDL